MIEIRTPAAPVARPKTPREVGEHAARYIEEHGWVQGMWCDVDGSVCIDGAVLAVMSADGSPFGPPVDHMTYNAVRNAISPAGPVNFNDAPECTLPEVLAALRSIR